MPDIIVTELSIFNPVFESQERQSIFFSAPRSNSPRKPLGLPSGSYRGICPLWYKGRNAGRLGSVPGNKSYSCPNLPYRIGAHRLHYSMDTWVKHSELEAALRQASAYPVMT